MRRLRRTLVDLLQRDISQADNAGPDWPTVVEDAVLRQDMEWVEESLAEVDQVITVNQAAPPHRASQATTITSTITSR